MVLTTVASAVSKPEREVGPVNAVVDRLRDPTTMGTPACARRAAADSVPSPPHTSNASSSWLRARRRNRLDPAPARWNGSMRAAAEKASCRRAAGCPRLRLGRGCEPGSAAVPRQPSEKPRTRPGRRCARCARRRLDDGVEAGAVAASGEDAEAHGETDPPRRQPRSSEVGCEKVGDYAAARAGVKRVGRDARTAAANAIPSAPGERGRPPRGHSFE